MTAEQKDLQSMVTASSLARQAILDTYGHYVDEEARFTAWVVRGIKKITRQVTKSNKRYAILNINKNTRSATLPCDFKELICIYVINNCGQRVYLNINSKLVNTAAFEEIPCENECNAPHSCDCIPKQACVDLQTTQQINKIRIGDTDYDETVTATLQPNGEYHVVTTTPYLDIDNSGIIYRTTTEYITTFDVEDCGCIKQTERNECMLENLCPDIWACYCCDDCAIAENDIGGYRVFIESGIVKFDRNFAFDKAYMEYRGFLPKSGNEYLVPEVASEALINYAKFKSVENKKGVTRTDREWHLERYEQEYKNMRIILCRVSIDDLINRAMSLPKFDYHHPVCVTTGTLNNNNNVNNANVAVSIIENTVTPSTGLPSTGCNPSIITTNGQEMEGGVRYRGGNPDLRGVPIRIYANPFNRMLREDEYVRNTDGGFTVLTGVYGLLDEFDIYPKWCDANITDSPATPIFVGSFKKSFKVDGTAGMPVAGTFVWQHADFIGAQIEDIYVNKMQETAIDGDFTHDPVTGIITRTQMFQTDDTGIVNYVK